jgi:hypothetical protein
VFGRNGSTDVFRLSVGANQVLLRTGIRLTRLDVPELGFGNKL